MMFSADFILQLIIGIGSAVGVYAGIKSDLAVTREKAEIANRRADEAHTRIDDLFRRK
jgi:hypothetical protein